MTKTDVSAKTQTPGPGRGLAGALAAFALVLTVGGLYFAFSGGDGQVVDQTTVPTPTTVLEPEPETMTDLEIIEAGVDALYSGDADRAAELFELPARGGRHDDSEDEWIRDEAAYQAAMEGRATVDCNERESQPGVFTCTWLYHNAFTDAIGYVVRRVDDVPGRYVYGDTLRVVVDDGVITAFSEFPFYDWESPIIGGLEAFLGENGFGYPYTMRGSFSPESVDFVLNHLDEWAAWAETNLELPDTADR